MPRATTRTKQPVNIFTGCLSELTDKLLTVTTKESKSYLQNSWVGDYFENFAHACDRIQRGDEKLIDKFNEADKAELKTAFATRNTYTPATTGLFFSIADFLSGVPEYWYQEAEEETPQGKATDFYINIAAPATVTKDQVIKKLINIAQLIDSAEHKGQRLNIYLTLQGTPGPRNPHKEKVTFTVKIKEESQPIDLQQMVYLVATPVLLRFAFMVLNTERVGSYAGNYITSPEDEEAHLGDESIIYIPSFYHDHKHHIYNYKDLKAVYPHLKDSID